MPTFLFKVGKIAYLRKSFRFIKSCERYRRDSNPFEWTAQFSVSVCYVRVSKSMSPKEGKAHMSMAVSEPITNFRSVFSLVRIKKDSCICHLLVIPETYNMGQDVVILFLPYVQCTSSFFSFFSLSHSSGGLKTMMDLPKDPLLCCQGMLEHHINTSFRVSSFPGLPCLLRPR